MPFTSIPRPHTSIWGVVQSAEQLLPGVWRVETAGHGGLILSEARQAAMPLAVRVAGGEYEEDVDWALPVLVFETELAQAAPVGADLTIRLAHDIARNWRPDAYQAITGTAVAARDSHVLRRPDAYQLLVGEVVVEAAFGAWADWVPDGKVGVVGRKIRSVDYLGRPTFEGVPLRALVAADRYDSARSPNGFAALEAEILT